MAEWRFQKGWTEHELEKRLARLKSSSLNFDDDAEDPRSPERWERYYSEAVVAQEPKGPPVPRGPFERAWEAISRYEFSDPDIVTGHFNPSAPLEGRRMLLELKVLGLRYLCGVVVSRTRQVRDGHRTAYAYRYDTLEGHIEKGSEWFVLTKYHDTGEVWFRIHASWKPGQFPNWWSHLGFDLVGRRYQRAWHRLAYLRLREILGSAKVLRPLPKPGHLFHAGPEILSGDPLLSGHHPVGRVTFIGNKRRRPDVDVKESIGS